MWRVETRHTAYDRDGYGHGFAGFVEVAELTEPAIVEALRRAYPELASDRTAAVELTFVEARQRAGQLHT